MEKNEIENLRKEVSDYTLTANLLNEILEKLKNKIILNSNLIMDANKEDVKINKKQIRIKTLLEIIDGYKETDLLLNNNERKIIIYKGDPYVSLHICLQALTQKTKVLLACEEFMIGVNKVIVEIFNTTLKEFKILNLINIYNNLSLDEINDLKILYNSITIIGITSVYEKLRCDNKNIKFFSYNNIILYCESDNLEKLKEAIFIYANENQYELEIIYSNSITEAIETINSDSLKNVAVLLTSNDENKKIFEENINKEKDVYVNDNPFKQEVGKIYNYL